MSTLKRTVLWIFGALAALGVAVYVWVGGLAKDDGGAGRPTYGTYTWQASEPASNAAGAPATDDDPRARSLPGTPRGGPVPRADGYVMGSLGHDYILPPMPPERATDIARKDSVFRNNAIKTCFWPGPKLRPGFYTTDPDDYGIENQLPDTGNTFSTAWFRIPAGAKIVVKGEFPHMRHWSFTTYTDDGVPRDVIDDIDIDPDAGSSNPFRDGVRRDVMPRRYTFAIANGDPPNPRPRNTVYTRSEPNAEVGMHMRNYVPDRSIDWTGGVGVPKVELHTADGKVLTGDAACAATAAPLRGKQVPLTVSKTAWMALNSLPWRPGDHTPAHAFEAEPLEKFYNRPYLITKMFFPPLAFDSNAVEKGGFWSNLATRYGYKYISQAYGKVYVVYGKMPRTPRTWNGDPTPMDQAADMRYWSICTVNAPATGNTVDCVHDENVQDTLDKQGNFTVVVARAPDRPANATEKCGVVWVEWGNGDGIPGGSKDFGAIVNRHTHVNPKFTHSWFAVKKPDSEREAMGDYVPQAINFHDKARFEALGCPVDTTKIAAMVKR